MFIKTAAAALSNKYDVAYIESYHYKDGSDDPTDQLAYKWLPDKPYENYEYKNVE